MKNAKRVWYAAYIVLLLMAVVVLGGCASQRSAPAEPANSDGQAASSSTEQQPDADSQQNENGSDQAAASTEQQVDTSTQESVLDEIQNRGTIRMAIFLGSESPLQRHNDAGEGEGYFVDVGNMIAEDLGVEAEFVDVEWKAILPTLLSGKADLIISGVSATPQRALSVEFPGTIVYYDVAVLVHEDGDIASVADLKEPGVVIAVSEGSTQHFYAQSAFPDAELHLTNGPGDARLEVVSGRSDATLQDSYHAVRFMAEYPETQVLRDANGEIEIVSREVGSITIRPGDQRFYNWIENWTEWYREQGTLDAMYKEWMGELE